MKLIALMTTVCFSGCSFFAVRGPGDTFEEMQECTENYGSPTADVFGTMIFTALSIAAFADGGSESGCPEDGDICIDWDGAFSNAFGVILAIPALIYAVSSVSGFSRTSQCRSAKERWREHNRTSRLIDQAIHASSF